MSHVFFPARSAPAFVPRDPCRSRRPARRCPRRRPGAPDWPAWTPTSTALVTLEDENARLRDQNTGQQAQHDALQVELTATRDALETARLELQALDTTLASTFADGAPKPALPSLPLLPHLADKRVLYVGGCPGCTNTLAQLLAAAGGELLVHDGGIEDRQSLLATMLARACLVVFPVDCISHNAMHIAKQAGARQHNPCHPLRSASVASFVALMQKLAAQGAHAMTP